MEELAEKDACSTRSSGHNNSISFFRAEYLIASIGSKPIINQIEKPSSPIGINKPLIDNKALPLPILIKHIIITGANIAKHNIPNLIPFLLVPSYNLGQAKTVEHIANFYLPEVGLGAGQGEFHYWVY